MVYATPLNHAPHDVLKCGSSIASFPGSPAISTRMTFDPARKKIKSGGRASRPGKFSHVIDVMRKILSIPNMYGPYIRYRQSFTQHVAAVTRGARNRNAKATALPRWRASLKWAKNSSGIYSRDRRKTGGSS